MSKYWISNTIFVSGFTDAEELFAYLCVIRDLPRGLEDIHLASGHLIDLDYFAINVSLIQGQLRLALSFLSDNDLAEKDHTGLYPAPFHHLKLTYAAIDTRTEAVELYNISQGAVTSRKSVPRGLGRALLADLERLPDPDRNISLSLQDLDVMDGAEFAAALARIRPAG